MHFFQIYLCNKSKKTISFFYFLREMTPTLSATPPTGAAAFTVIDTTHRMTLITAFTDTWNTWECQIQSQAWKSTAYSTLHFTLKWVTANATGCQSIEQDCISWPSDWAQRCATLHGTFSAPNGWDGSIASKGETIFNTLSSRYTLCTYM